MIFVTKHIEDNRGTPRIEAQSWEEAEQKCPKDLIVIGILVEEIDWDVSDEFLFRKIVTLN